MLLERVEKVMIMLYTLLRGPNGMEMNQLNYAPRKPQAEAASEAVRGSPLWKRCGGLCRD